MTSTPGAESPQRQAITALFDGVRAEFTARVNAILSRFGDEVDPGTARDLAAMLDKLDALETDALTGEA